ncbi:MAG: peptidylprolyl isomerase [Acidobacteria bacterium]|nr:peptidylprolyl isomerase [Acidobacteriota bacterium]
MTCYASLMGGLRCSRCGLVLLALAGALSCGVDEDVLAQVGRQRLYMAPFQVYVGEVTGEIWQGVDTRAASRLLDQYLDQQVILEAARQKDVGDVSEEGRQRPREMRLLLEELCGTAPSPPESMVEEEVARRASELRPARAHVRQMLVDSQEQAEAARERLIAGNDFVEISREVSRAPNAAAGGELGFVDQGGLPPEIDEVIFSLAAGEISDPVQSPSGYHVFQVLEVVPAGPPDHRELEVAVRAELRRKATRTHLRQCIRDLASEIGVEVQTRRLWFPYRGKYAEEQDEA